MKKAIIALMALMPISYANEISGGTTYDKATYDNSIEVNGNTANFTYKDPASPDHITFTRLHAKLEAKNKATVNMLVNDSGYLFEGEGASLIVDETSTVNASHLYFDDKSKMENRGTIETDCLHAENGALVTNHGDIIFTGTDDDEFLQITAQGVFTNHGNLSSGSWITVMQGGSFYAEDGSSMCAMDVGIFWPPNDEKDLLDNYLYINGSVSATGYLNICQQAEIVFTLNSSIDMNGNAVSIDGGVIVLQLDEEVTDTTNIFKNDFFTNYSGDFDDDMEVVIRGKNGTERTMTFGELSVPEPTTATLSLLALAGLAVRRRRR